MSRFHLTKEIKVVKCENTRRCKELWKNKNCEKDEVKEAGVYQQLILSPLSLHPGSYGT